MVSGLCGQKFRGGGESEDERGRKRQGESEVVGVLFTLVGARMMVRSGGCKSGS